MRYKFDRSPLIKELELHNNPVTIRVNKFTEDSAAEFQRKMAMAHNTGQEIIPVIIDSYGGQVYSLMAMISAIKNSELPVATIVEGKAMSCGALLFSFGTEGHRYMDPYATVMIHDVSAGAIGKIEELKANSEEANRLNEQVFKMMAQNIGKSDKYFLKRIHEKGHADWYLTPQECKKINLANHLRVPVLNIRVKVEMELE
jgi:ATP-dependent Clp endopeptidase proteolytic subunit ClpP